MPFSTFAIAGVGNIGSFITEELLKQKDAGKATEVVVLTRSVCLASVYPQLTY